MSTHIAAYRLQIEAAGLPVERVLEDGNAWPSIGFKHEFEYIALFSQEDDPHYCRLVLGYDVEGSFEGREDRAIAAANAANMVMRIAKTTVRFRESGAILEIACEFFSGENFAILPSLERYVRILHASLQEFNKQLASGSDYEI